MNAFASALRRPHVAPASARRLLSASARRHASNVPRAFAPPHYSPRQWVQHFLPTEAIPIVSFVTCMLGFATYMSAKSVRHNSGDLRLVPDRYRDGPSLEPWESERALAGKW
ncbi:hypothetical protein JCM1841_003971 [Sporobolomyces salmonicolor]